ASGAIARARVVGCAEMAWIVHPGGSTTLIPLFAELPTRESRLVRISSLQARRVDRLRERRHHCEASNALGQLLSLGNRFICDGWSNHRRRGAAAKLDPPGRLRRPGQSAIRGRDYLWQFSIRVRTSLVETRKRRRGSPANDESDIPYQHADPVVL